MATLHYGPGAVDACLLAATAAVGARGFIYPMLPEPSEDGSIPTMKREDVDEALRRANAPLFGHDRVAVPLYLGGGVRGGTLDALLKTIEEPPIPGITLFCCAADLSEVPETILSRVKTVFAAGEGSHEEVSLEDLSPASLLETLSRYRGRERALVVDVFAYLVSTEGAMRPDKYEVVERLRPLLDAPILTPAMILQALWATSASSLATTPR